MDGAVAAGLAPLVSDTALTEPYENQVSGFVLLADVLLGSRPFSSNSLVNEQLRKELGEENVEKARKFVTYGYPTIAALLATALAPLLLAAGIIIAIVQTGRCLMPANRARAKGFLKQQIGNVLASPFVIWFAMVVGIFDPLRSARIVAIHGPFVCADVDKILSIPALKNAARAAMVARELMRTALGGHSDDPNFTAEQNVFLDKYMPLLARYGSGSSLKKIVPELLQAIGLPEEVLATLLPGYGKETTEGSAPDLQKILFSPITDSGAQDPLWQKIMALEPNLSPAEFALRCTKDQSLSARVGELLISQMGLALKNLERDDPSFAELGDVFQGIIAEINGNRSFAAGAVKGIFSLIAKLLSEMLNPRIEEVKSELVNELINYSTIKTEDGDLIITPSLNSGDSIAVVEALFAPEESSRRAAQLFSEISFKKVAERFSSPTRIRSIAEKTQRSLLKQFNVSQLRAGQSAANALIEKFDSGTSLFFHPIDRERIRSCLCLDRFPNDECGVDHLKEEIDDVLADLEKEINGSKSAPSPEDSAKIKKMKKLVSAFDRAKEMISRFRSAKNVLVAIEKDAKTKIAEKVMPECETIFQSKAACFMRGLVDCLRIGRPVAPTQA
ncbi:MAG: hypothetical protein LBB14_03605 [Puniceicoccales bacterium]|jgi:hypothetical protein|nr:hypothetical protein [Puniceicoccales bacterium]